MALILCSRTSYKYTLNYKKRLSPEKSNQPFLDSYEKMENKSHNSSINSRQLSMLKQKQAENTMNLKKQLIINRILNISPPKQQLNSDLNLETKFGSRLSPKIESPTHNMSKSNSP